MDSSFCVVCQRGFSDSALLPCVHLVSGLGGPLVQTHASSSSSSAAFIHAPFIPATTTISNTQRFQLAPPSPHYILPAASRSTMAYPFAHYSPPPPPLSTQTSTPTSIHEQSSLSGIAHRRTDSSPPSTDAPRSGITLSFAHYSPPPLPPTPPSSSSTNNAPRSGTARRRTDSSPPSTDAPRSGIAGAASSTNTVPVRKKRKVNAFLAYAVAHRKRVRQTDPFLHETELLRTISREWKELPPNERRVYEELAAQMNKSR